MIGVGNFDPDCVRVCLKCHTRQFSTSNDCRFCDGNLVVHSKSGGLPARRIKDRWDIDPWPKFEARELPEIIKAKVHLSREINTCSENTSESSLSNIGKSNESCKCKNKGSCELGYERNLSNEIFHALETITCSVCLDTFDSPTTLPCGHSVCSKHVDDMIYKCPICRGSYASLSDRPVRINKELDMHTKEILHLIHSSESENVMTKAKDKNV